MEQKHTEEKKEALLVSDTAVIDGVEMAYCRFGRGSRVFVILPGLSLKPVVPSAAAIRQAFAAFEDDYLVYLFDGRTNPPQHYSVVEMANDTFTVMRSLGIEKACIFGASLGGMVAQCIAIEHPEMVEKLVLGSSLARKNDSICTAIEAWLRLAEEKEGYLLNEAIANAIYSEATMAAFGEVLLSAGNSVTAEDMEHFALMGASILDFDIYDRLDAIKCDVLVLGCAGDKVTTLEGSKELVARLHCAYYYYGAEYGHAVYDEAPDYRPRMLAFLNSAPIAHGNGERHE